MSEKTYTWEEIERAFGFWWGKLSHIPDNDLSERIAMELLRKQLDSRPHWQIHLPGSTDPFRQRVEVYWTGCKTPVLSLHRPLEADAINKGLEELQRVLELYFPAGPSEF